MLHLPTLVLVRRFRSRPVDLRLGRSRFVADRSRRLRERDPPGAALDHLHVDRSYRQHLVRLRLGDPTARDRIPVDLSLPVDRSAAISKIASADFGVLAFSLAWLSDHGRRRADQIARRRLLARSDLHVLPLRNAADPEPDQPLSAFLAALVSQTRSAWNHFVELIVPWFSFGPRTARHIAGVLLVLFQVLLIISGNLSFLNYLTIIPFLACFDDTFLRRVLPKALVKRAEKAAAQSQPSRIRNGITVALAIIGGVAEHTAGDESRRRPTIDEFLVRSARFGEHLRRVRDGWPRARRNCVSKEPTTQSSPAKPNGKNTNSKPNRAIPTGVRHSSRRINRESTGKSGSPRWRRPRNIRGRSISSGNFCTMTRTRCRFSPTIRFRIRRRISSARGCIVINSRRWASKAGGSAS